MHNLGDIEYRCTNRQGWKWRERGVNKINSNLIHDSLYTFADEYYEELRQDYLKNYLPILEEKTEDIDKLKK